MPARIESIAQAWDDYRAIVVPKNAGPTQVQECRRAFYAGAESLLVVILQGLSPGPDSTPSDEDYIARLHAELHAFARDCKEGRA
jgi:hypothetical protein